MGTVCPDQCSPLSAVRTLISWCITYYFLQDVFEIQKNSVQPGQKVVIVDDLLATGGNVFDILVTLLTI